MSIYKIAIAQILQRKSRDTSLLSTLSLSENSNLYLAKSIVEIYNLILKKLHSN